MAETPSNPNQYADHNDLRPFSELLARSDVVYHGIGADLMALQGISTHGILSTDQQIDSTGIQNDNSPRRAAWNGNDKVSVAKAPRPGLPNEAFMTYIEDRPISFAINSDLCPVEEPTGRGLFDEAFIKGAPDEAIIGVLLDGNSLDRPITEMPIVGRLTTADKARSFMGFLIRDYDPGFEAELPELEALIGAIQYSASPFVANNEAIISRADDQSIESINKFLQERLALALEKKFGRSNQTVIEMVRDTFPTKSLYVNNHDNGINAYTETDYFDTLGIDEMIGYDRWDGEDGGDGFSIHKLRRELKIQREAES